MQKDLQQLELKKSKEEKISEAKKKLGQKVSNLEEILKMPDEKFYDYLNLNSQIKNWNDFSQAKFPNKSFNDIKMLDIDNNSKSSYIKGFEFFEENSFKYIYLEKFEDNFRKFLEDCDRLELLNLNVDFNSFWGGLSNKLIESFDDETPKITKVILGSDIHSSFMKLNKNNNEKKKDFHIDLNNILKNEDLTVMEKLEKNADKFTQNLEKLVNYLWYFTDLEENRRNILFHPILRGMNPSIVKDIYNYQEPFNSEDPLFNYFFSSISGANLHNLLIPLRSKFCGNSNYLNNLNSASCSSLNFFESNISLMLDRELSFNFPKLYGEKKFRNNGYIFNLNRNSRTIVWPLLFSNLEKTKNKNFTIVHGFNENYKFLDEKIEGYLRKTANFNYTAIDSINLPFCFPRKVYLRNVYKNLDSLALEEKSNLSNENNKVINENQKILLNEENKEKIQDQNKPKEIFLNKMNMSSTYSPFNEYTKKFIHVIPQMLKKYDIQVKKYLNNFDMGKYVEYKEKMELYYEFLDNYKQHDFYSGLGLSDSEDEEDDYDN